MKLVAIIAGIAVAAWGGVITYRALFLEPSTTVVITSTEVNQYPNTARLAAGILMLVIGACLAFFAARRKPM